MNVRMNVRHCIIAGCIYSALYWVERPADKQKPAFTNDPVPVCRKCMEDLVSSYRWKYVRHMTKEEREND